MNPSAFEERFVSVLWLQHTNYLHSLRANYLLLDISGDLLSLFPAQLFPNSIKPRCLAALYQDVLLNIFPSLPSSFQTGLFHGAKGRKAHGLSHIWDVSLQQKET